MPLDFVDTIGSFYNMVQHDTIPDSKVHGANMGPTWGRQDPGGPHVGHVNLAIWDGNNATNTKIDHSVVKSFIHVYMTYINM